MKSREQRDSPCYEYPRTPPEPFSLTSSGQVERALHKLLELANTSHPEADWYYEAAKLGLLYGSEGNPLADLVPYAGEFASPPHSLPHIVRISTVGPVFPRIGIDPRDVFGRLDGSWNPRLPPLATIMQSQAHVRHLLARLQIGVEEVAAQLGEQGFKVRYYLRASQFCGCNDIKERLRLPLIIPPCPACGHQEHDKPCQQVKYLPRSFTPVPAASSYRHIPLLILSAAIQDGYAARIVFCHYCWRFFLRESASPVWNCGSKACRRKAQSERKRDSRERKRRYTPRILPEPAQPVAP